MIKKLKLIIGALMTLWIPQAGFQVRAVQFPVDFPFFGGARGGGLFAGTHLVGEDQHGRQWNGLIVQRKYSGLTNCAGALIN